MTRMVRCLLLGIATVLVLAAPASAKEDMTIWGHAVHQPIHRDETTQLKFTIKNNGPRSATGVWVQATVPEGLHVLGTKLYGGRSCRVDGTFVKCQMGDFVNQQVGTLLIDVRGDTVGTWITPAEVWSTDGRDTDRGNGHVEASVMVRTVAGSGGPQRSWPDGSSGEGPVGLTLAARMQARFEKVQRVVHDGGIRITMRVPRAGALLAGAKVRVGGSFVTLAEVSRRRVTSGRAWPLWLGATPEDRRTLREALGGGRTLPARIWVRYKDETIRYDLRVRR